MYRPRSPFVIPQVHGSTGRKPYQKRQMSIEPQNQQIQKKQAQLPLHSNNSQLKASLSTIDQKFSIDLGTPIEPDGYTYWTYLLNNQVTNQYSKRLIFRQANYLLKGVTQDQIPSSVSIIAQGFSAYKNKQGLAQNRVCTLLIKSVSTLVDDAGQKTYDILYQQSQDVNWEFPTQMTDLEFKIAFDNQLIAGQLSSKIMCLFDIRHVGR